MIGVDDWSRGILIILRDNDDDMQLVLCKMCLSFTLNLALKCCQMHYERLPQDDVYEQCVMQRVS